MVAILAMVFIVVHSMFMLTVMLLIFTGELALLYQSTHYACRGGSSSFGTYCGTFSVVTVYGVGSTYWLIGAALSFKFHFYL